MKSVSTFTSQIHIGLHRENTNDFYTLEIVKFLCKKYCNQFDWAVSVLATDILYKNGSQPGAIIMSMIPEKAETIMFHATEMSKMLMRELQLINAKVVYPDETVVIEKTDL